ncbi:MAG: HDOD domain-containing protein [Deltaproteobacteria bacterium]|jgi:HD-like signal output (HDOD) protein|nr:HDOD domain-containing protein [Deltaproteobacteria bacterium]
MTNGPNNEAGQLPPSQRDLEVLKYRFRLADMEDPATQAIFKFTESRLPRENSGAPAYYKKARKNDSHAVSALDPVNIVQMEIKLPSMPTVLTELQTVTSNANSSARLVGEVIAKDPSLTAWVLKLVNSPFFGFAVKVDTVTRAVTLLGVEQIKTLAIGGMLQNMMVRLPADIIDLDYFWRHSIATALAAQSIWKLMGREEGERLFVAGLLHDCGMLALAYTTPDMARSLNSICRATGRMRYQLEQELISFDHARLGGMLLHRWNLPLPLVMAVLRHHQVEAPERYTEAAVVHLADMLAIAVAGDSESDLVPRLDPEVWNTLGLTIPNINFVADAVMDQLHSFCSLLKI